MQLGNVLYFLLWAVAFFLMMRFGCGAHVLGHGHQHGTSPGDGTGERPEHAVDPVCGKTVDIATAKSTLYGGHAYYFCSNDCRSTFEASPASYRASSASSRHEGHHHGC